MTRSTKIEAFVYPSSEPHRAMVDLFGTFESANGTNERELIGTMYGHGHTTVEQQYHVTNVSEIIIAAESLLTLATTGAENAHLECDLTNGWQWVHIGNQ